MVYGEQKGLRCVYMRGGTSKGMFFRKEELPEDENLWPEIFLRVMGSPDPKQIDGMGGCVSSTSKAAVVCRSERTGFDVDYTFCQVGIDEAVTDMNVNCGNLSSAVGPFAIDEGIVKAVEPETVVRIYNTNTGKAIVERVIVKDGKACVKGDAVIAGVPGTGAEIDVSFESPGGSRTGMLFPTENRKEMLMIPELGAVTVTIIDCATPAVIISASDLGLEGIELTELSSRKDFMGHIERIRGEAARKMGFVESWDQAALLSAAAPDVILAAGPKSYSGIGGEKVSAADTDLCVRAVSMGAVHRAFPVTAAIAAAAAARMPGTILWDLAAGAKCSWTNRRGERGEIRLGHASGIMRVTIESSENDIVRAEIVRTARRIMDGTVYLV